MTWLDTITLALYTFNTVLVGIGWEPFVTVYNHVILILQDVSE